MHHVYVLPVQAGWLVTTSVLKATLAFRSGAQAEAQGRRLATCLASGGATAWLVIHDRSGTVIERSVYRPVAYSAATAHRETELRPASAPRETIAPRSGPAVETVSADTAFA
ncbi:hypothetical protein [Phenylobacterium hankyongense]|nr:hypothetical protein [Phenylobacterium hankyongense]